MTKATEPFPILVGITGNRTFADDPAENETLRTIGSQPVGRNIRVH